MRYSDLTFRKALLYIVLLMAVAIAATFITRAIIYRPIECDKWQEGMVIFHESKSQQSPLIKAVTASRWTHCGIVVKTSEGLKVLEASKTVRLVPVEEFCKRGKVGDYIVCLPRKRLSKPISYKKYLGQPYDLSFKFDNGKMYCSELVWIIYKEQGIEICSPRSVGTYPLYWLPIKKVQSQIEKRKISASQPTVSPVRLVNHMRRVKGL